MQAFCLPGAKADNGSRTDEASEYQAIVDEFVASRDPIEPLGIIVANVHDFEGKAALAVKRALNMGDRLQILYVEPGSLAEELGLKVGDELIEINDHYVSRGTSALQQFQDRVIARIDWSADVDATVLRDGFGQTRSTRSGRKNTALAN